MTFYVLAQVNEEGDAFPYLCCASWFSNIPIGEDLARDFRHSVLKLVRAIHRLNHQDFKTEVLTAEYLVKSNPDLVGIVLANVDPVIEEEYLITALDQQKGSLLLAWLKMAEEEEKDAI